MGGPTSGQLSASAAGTVQIDTVEPPGATEGTGGVISQYKSDIVFCPGVVI